MTILIAGLLLFACAHLFPSVFSASRNKLATRLGSNAYRGLFSLLIVTSLVLIVIGWRSTAPAFVYDPPFAGGIVTSLVILIAFILFVASQTRSNIKRLARHPQMLAVILWSVAHLLVNGDMRSVLLFGGMGTWAVLEIVFCNRRDGSWQKPAPAPRIWDIATVAFGATAFVILALLHETLFNVAPYSG